MILTDRYAYCNKIKHVHPFEKLIFTILTLMICVSINSPVVSITTIILMSFITINIAGIPAKFYLKLLFIPIYFLIVGTAVIAVNPIHSSGEAILVYKNFHINLVITTNSLLMAENTFLKALGSISCLYFLSLTTPLIEIISILRKFKVPELFLELMSLIYRFIFILMESADTILHSQTSRLGYTGLHNTFNSLGLLASNLFILSYKRAQDLYTALESRGYTGTINVLENQYKFSKKNLFLIFMIEIILLIIPVFSRNLL